MPSTKSMKFLLVESLYSHAIPIDYVVQRIKFSKVKSVWIEFHWSFKLVWEFHVLLYLALDVVDLIWLEETRRSTTEVEGLKSW